MTHFCGVALSKRFDGQETSGYRSKPFRVTYYRSRQEYNGALRPRQPRIETTLGIYFDTTRSTHFFTGPEQDAGTIYHEAVHQFFQESRHAARSVGGLSNSWLVEGVACYFESLAEHDDPKIVLLLETPVNGGRFYGNASRNCRYSSSSCAKLRPVSSTSEVGVSRPA